ncbi:MAG: exosome complex protein Rrp42 [Candidatus Bilamarchaeaceae archaeon]
MMAESFKDAILHDVRKDVILSLLKEGKRIDGRGVSDYRKISVQANPIKSADGSALAKIGDTQVIAAVKFDLGTPYADRPDEGTFITSSEFLPSANQTFEPGPPNADSIELARVVDRGIRSAEIIDTKSLFVEEGKVLNLFLDLYIINQSGNLTDTAGLAAIAALMDSKMPKVEDGKVVYGEYVKKLEIQRTPVAVTSLKLGEHWIADPTFEEESAFDTRLTISVVDDMVCTMQKGPGKLTKAELLERIDFSIEKGKDLRRVLS